ncbi:hypothetical protein AcidC75_29740 [Acidisoma sp. C75]
MRIADRVLAQRPDAAGQQHGRQGEAGGNRRGTANAPASSGLGHGAEFLGDGSAAVTAGCGVGAGIVQPGCEEFESDPDPPCQTSQKEDYVKFIGFK